MILTFSLFVNDITERTCAIMKGYSNKRVPQKWPVFIVTIFLSLWLTSNLKAQDTGSGKELYQYYCAQCHGEKGDGKGINATEDLPTQPKDFTSPKNLPVFSDEQIINTVTHGGPREQLSFIMPPWGDILSAEEIGRLRAYLREICQCKFDPAAAAKAKAEQEKQKQ
jgi:cytochrome c oxidase cbb3-type subunit 3